MVNLNNATNIHRDRHDKDICSVVVISDCTGGALVFLELGLVIELQNGDQAIFKLSELSHFNLHFEGWCLSLVFHMDKAADAWTDAHNPRNGWSLNKYFQGS